MIIDLFFSAWIDEGHPGPVFLVWRNLRQALTDVD